jgi:hypothetical protein
MSEAPITWRWMCATNDILKMTLEVVLGRRDVSYANEEHAARQVVDAAIARNKPILIHLDEVGGHDGHNIRQLQMFAGCVWMEIWEAKQRDPNGAMPVIYFFATGKNTEVFFNFELMGVGYDILVLDMLKQKHVREVREDLQSIRHQYPLALSGLDKVDLCDYLDARLCDTTGGAPRLLLYNLRSLHYLCKYQSVRLDSIAAIDIALEKVFDVFRGL